jgi:hypothetical protein
LLKIMDDVLEADSKRFLSVLTFDAPWRQIGFLGVFCTGVWTLRHSTSPIFVKGFLRLRVSQTICLGWFWTEILLSSVSWVPRITGASHWCLAQIVFLYFNTHCLSEGTLPVGEASGPTGNSLAMRLLWQVK